MLKIWRRLKFLANIKKSIPFLLKFFKSSEVSFNKKFLSVLLMIGYLLFPWDLIPDFLIFIGLVDDVAVLAFILQQIVKMAPESLKEEFQLN
ncbi:YkvA family protein [Halobacillus seohaensis]|uniref:YkvA family protein n=1 Tax=Halobacillus seohaensis TaxID=447421 RepID=A0ABW2EMQ7_9BACI